MGEFSAHRVSITSVGDGLGDSQNTNLITGSVNLYVSTTGDDVLNTGIEDSSPFKTVKRAFRWLDDKVISETGFVTINFAAGIYDIDEELVFTHPQGERVSLIGADPDILLATACTYYKTYGLTSGSPHYGYYSGVTHDVIISINEFDDANYFTTATSTTIQNGNPGSGIIVEDYELAYDDDYNPILYYGSYPYDPRNNITRQSTLLGAHTLRGITGATGTEILVSSSIRDDWICIGAGVSSGFGRYFGNPQINSYFHAGGTSEPQDFDVPYTNNWLLNASQQGGSPLRGMFMSNTPVGFYGTSIKSGITTGATANFVSGLFPTRLNGVATSDNPTDAGYWLGTGGWTGLSNIGGTNATSLGLSGYWFTGTGTIGSLMNDGICFGYPNYHQYNNNGPTLTSSSKVINTNRLTVKIIPTVFRRFGNILTIKNSGLRKIKNIFFDGRQMLYHYNFISEYLGSKNVVSNKCAINVQASRIGLTVRGEPNNLGPGLMHNVGVKDFHCAMHINEGTRCNLGTMVSSNCSFGVVARNQSIVTTTGSVFTGMGVFGVSALTSSTITAERCFVGIVGTSLVTFRYKQIGDAQEFSDKTFIPGQTYSSPDGKFRGTVWDWEPREKLLTVSVRKGVAEGLDPFSQY